MRFVSTERLQSALFCAYYYFHPCLTGQIYQFKNYGVGSKIPNNFIYTLNQDKSGYLWIGTGNGLSKFDGFDFYNVAFPDSAPGRYPVSSLKDKNGNLWFGCNDGSVFRTEEGHLKPVGIKNSKTISTLAEGPDGFIYIVPQGGSVFRVSSKDPGEIKTYPVDSEACAVFGMLYSIR